MPTGIECYDAARNVTFSATDYLGRVLGTINVTGSAGNGSYPDPALLSGTGWALFFSDGTGVSYVPCVVTVSGQIINWTFGGNYANQGLNPSGYIVYGIK